MRAGVQLSVGKGARAALAELHVALRIQRAAGAERVHGGLAGERVAAALDNYRPRARHGQHERGEHARGAEAGNDGARRALAGRNARDGIFRRSIFAHVRRLDAGDYAPLIPGDGERGGADIVYIVLMPRVEGALYERELLHLRARQTQLLRRARTQGGSILAGGEAQLSYKYHSPSLPAIWPLAHAHWRL